MSQQQALNFPHNQLTPTYETVTVTEGVVTGGNIVPSSSLATVGSAAAPFAGLYLGNNATPSTVITELSYYEEWKSTSNTFTGPWSSPPTAALKLERIGSQCILTVAQVAAASTNANAVATSSVNIPARFLPAADLAFAAPNVWNNDASANGGAKLDHTTGALVIGVAAAPAASPVATPVAFTNSAAAGWNHLVLVWSLQ